MAGFEALSEAEVIRSRNYTAFEIPVRDLSLPVRAESRMDVTEQAFIESAPPEDFVVSLQRAIEAGFGVRVPTTREAAELARMSSRTLQRSLKSQGVTYREVLDRARLEYARSLLCRGDVVLAELAVRLGYSETSNFSHAFKRWTGVSPSEYRRRN